MPNTPDDSSDSAEPSALDVAFDTPQEATIDGSTASTLLRSIELSVIPALEQRIGRIALAIDAESMQSGRVPEHAHNRLAVERNNVVLLKNLTEPLKQLQQFVVADDIALVTSACRSALNGIFGSPMYDLVRAVVRTKSRAGRITVPAAQLVWRILDAQKVLEDALAEHTRLLVIAVGAGEQPQASLVHEIDRCSELMRELSERGVRADELGAHIDEGISAPVIAQLQLVANAGDVVRVLPTIDAALSIATTRSGQAPTT